MRQFYRLVLFGFLTWLIPFAVSFVVFPFKTSNRALFESVMAVTVTLSAVIFTILYYQKLRADYLTEGFLLGAVWLAISIFLDLALFMEGPMKMSFVDYMADIGLTYLIIPVVTLGVGYLLEQKIGPRAI